MTLNQLQYFTQVVRQRSFTRAAQLLHVSQPALSKSVRLLEQEFGAQRHAGDAEFTDESGGIL